MLQSTRYGIEYPDPVGRGDSADVPRDIASLVAAIEDSVMYGQGTVATRPPSASGNPGIQGRLFFATDEGVLYWDTGTGWIQIGFVRSGTHANRPAPDSINAGSMYFETDTNGGTLFRSTGTAWVPVAPAVQWPATYIEWLHTWGGGPDTNYRVTTNASADVDTHNTAGTWISNAAAMVVTPPGAGMYLMAFGSKHPNQESGLDGRFITRGTSFLHGLRGSIAAGGDPSANLGWSGLSFGPVLQQISGGDALRIGGYWSGGGSQRSWLFMLRLLAY